MHGLLHGVHVSDREGRVTARLYRAMVTGWLHLHGYMYHLV